MSDISPLARDRRGRRVKSRNKDTATTGNPGTVWRRLRGSRDNWSDLEKAGMNADWGTIVGKMYLHKVVTANQASALRLFAEVVGRYDRFQSPELRRTVASPAYQRGSRGEDGELGRRIAAGTIDQYERMSNRARKAHGKLQGCIPTEEARKMLEDICIYDREVESIYHKDLIVILNRIVQKFGIKSD